MHKSILGAEKMDYANYWNTGTFYRVKVSTISAF